MERVTIHDKNFKLFIAHDKIMESIELIAERINQDYSSKKPPLILSVLSGAFMFTSDLLKRLNFNCEIGFVKLSSYSGTSTTGEVKESLAFTKSVEGRDVIVIEDIVDTGITIEVLYNMLKERGATSIKICTLLLKPEAYTKSIPIDYVAIRIPNDFIVGYGLDYDEHGRNLKDIYVLEK